ncbi:MAG TPA: proprotein convertase P-domain-containing protein, partial [Dissulfurispiraceae bacterium]|nr:proprotein convertase P-domain-containing protein [Dissulfurispiraceae bacterium]
SGLAIWHVDELGSNDFEEMVPDKHYECSLEQADNSFDLEKGVNTGDAGDLFAGPAKGSFGDSTAPGSKWWDGTSSGLEIVEISPPGRQMTFKSKGNDGNIFSRTSSPARAIPDNNQEGVQDAIVFDDEAVVGSLKVSVDITHSWRGDLILTLISPSSTPVVLLNRNGGGTPNVKTAFDMSSAPELRNLADQPLKGKWTLWVQDLGPSDEGVLNSWGLEIKSKEGGAGTVIELEDLSAVKIPDNDPAGIMRAVNTDAPGKVKHAEVSVDITHTYIGDLIVSLISPQGTTTDLHHQFGGPQDNLIKTYTASTTPDLNKLAGEPIKGEWRLKVVDQDAADTGKLNRWSLRIIPS